MTKIFFDHIIDSQDILETLDMYQIESEERQELELLVDEILHHHVLNIILSRLPTDHHTEFITRITKSPEDPEIWIFLKQHAGETIEIQVQEVAQKVKEDVKKEIHKAKIKR